MATRRNQAEVVSLRSEANRVNSSINLPVILQLKNPRVFNEGEDDGFENKAERSRDKSASRSMMSTSRTGKKDR